MIKQFMRHPNEIYHDYLACTYLSLYRTENRGKLMKNFDFGLKNRKKSKKL